MCPKTCSEEEIFVNEIQLNNLLKSTQTRRLARCRPRRRSGAALGMRSAVLRLPGCARPGEAAEVPAQGSQVDKKDDRRQSAELTGKEVRVRAREDHAHPSCPSEEDKPSDQHWPTCPFRRKGRAEYVNHERPDVQAGFGKGRGTRDQNANIC